MNTQQIKQLKAGDILYDAKQIHYTVLLGVSEQTKDGLVIFPCNDDAHLFYNSGDVLDWSESAYLSEVEEDRLYESGYLPEQSSRSRLSRRR